MEYNNEIYNDDNDIQLKLFELFNYKNIEYLDCYIKNKLIKLFQINYYDCYNDDYDNIKELLICHRTININEKIIKFKFEYYNNELYMKIGNEIITCLGF